jgi:nicotinate-nucleotide adenylyltransferase
MGMRVGLYFGSFNPIHHGHLMIASHIMVDIEFDQVWFVVSPQNPFKSNNTLLNEYQRLHLVRLAIEDDPRFRVTDIEFRLPKPSYTSDTLSYLKDEYPQHEFSVILGSDSLMNFEKWKNYSHILESYRLYVYERPGFLVRTDLPGDIVHCRAPLLEISSTKIRSLVAKGNSIRYFVPESVREEIEKSHYYR